jgi:hypothetical protein
VGSPRFGNSRIDATSRRLRLGFWCLVGGQIRASILIVCIVQSFLSVCIVQSSTNLIGIWRLKRGQFLFGDWV